MTFAGSQFMRKGSTAPGTWTGSRTMSVITYFLPFLRSSRGSHWSRRITGWSDKRLATALTGAGSPLYNLN